MKSIYYSKGRINEKTKTKWKAKYLCLYFNNLPKPDSFSIKIARNKCWVILKVLTLMIKGTLFEILGD